MRATHLIALALASPLCCQDADREVRISWEKNRFVVAIDDVPFTEVRVGEDLPRPFLFPVFGAHGRPMTRNFPMKQGVADEATDHVHHRSLWFAHGAVNGHDFWIDGKARIVHDGVRELRSARGVAVLRTRNRWLSEDGELVCEDERELRFWAEGECRFIDFDIDIHASRGPLEFGDTKEGTMALRVHPALRLKGEVAEGSIVNSEGVRDDQAWGKRAGWVDYSGPIDGETVGVAILEHPSNLRHPTWWHARDYGLVAANPFGVSDFEGREPRGDGDYELPEGETLRLRYRFVFHPGDAKTADIAGRYRDYSVDDRTTKR